MICSLWKINWFFNVKIKVTLLQLTHLSIITSMFNFSLLLESWNWFSRLLNHHWRVAQFHSSIWHNSYQPNIKMKKKFLKNICFDFFYNFTMFSLFEIGGIIWLSQTLQLSYYDNSNNFLRFGNIFCTGTPCMHPPNLNRVA